MAKHKKSKTNEPNPTTTETPEIALTPDPAPAPESASATEPAPALVSATEPAAASEPAATPAPKKGGRRKVASAETTLAELAEGYLAHLDESGKSQGTVFSYRLELAVAMDEVGAETKVADLTSDAVLGFFTSDRVNKTRTGVLKARVSVLKTQRVFRQALVWAQEAGLVEKAPLPEDAATY